MNDPYVVQRIAHDDGGFHYEILDWRPGSYRIVCWVDEDEQGNRMQAKRDADNIAHALNQLEQSETEIDWLRTRLLKERLRAPFDGLNTACFKCGHIQSVLCDGTDPTLRKFWLMGEPGVDLPPHVEEG